MSNPGERIPVLVLTGFLGSGKTTLLNALLRAPALKDAAVIVNEFGEIGIDHLLIETAFEDAVLLKSGCICCTVRGDLVDTLETLWERRSQAQIPAFTRTVIETTGLAEPGPVMRTLMAEPAITARFRLAGVVTTVDALHGEGQLDRHAESMQQAALADRLVITKTDLAKPDDVDRLARRLTGINPSAPQMRAVRGQVDVETLLDLGLYDAERREASIAHWLRDDSFGAHGHAHAHDVNRHHDIRAFCVTRDRPLPWPAFRTWLESVASLRGADLLRVKGVVNVEGQSGPVVIHGVQHVFHPPTVLPRWPEGDDHRTRLVFIVRGIEPDSIEASLDAALAL